MKNLIVKINDILVYIGFILLAIIVVGVTLSGNVGSAVITLLVGGVMLSVISGLWIVLSGISDKLDVQNKLMQKMLDK